MRGQWSIHTEELPTEVESCQRLIFDLDHPKFQNLEGLKASRTYLFRKNMLSQIK